MTRALLAALLLAAALAQPVCAEELVKAPGNINAIQYTDDMWDEEFLGIEAEEPV